MQIPTHPPPLRPTAAEWLPPQAFLPQERLALVTSGLTSWASSQGTPYRQRHSGRAGPSPSAWSPQQDVDDWSATQTADRAYDSVDGLAAAWHASMATLTAMPEFHAWQRSNPAFKPLLSGFLWTVQGPRRVTALLDTGATHCYICARLAAALGLRPSGQAGPTSVSTAAAGEALGLAAPVLIHLSLGDAFRESLSVSPMDMDVGADHDLYHLYADGQVRIRSGPALLRLDLLPASARPAARALSVISHGAFRRLLRQIEREHPVVAETPPDSAAAATPQLDWVVTAAPR